MIELMEDEARLLDLLSLLMVLMGLLSFVLLRFIRMPYGRHGSSAFGPLIPVRLAWFIQEVPALAVPLYNVLTQPDMPTPSLLLMGFFLCHYFQRTLIFPFLIRGGKPTPLLSFILAFIFCSYNGYLQSSYLCKHATYPSDWTRDPRFITGSALFFCGMSINIYSDHILRNLRKPGESGYKIPHGGLFEYVSAANFFGEIVEWSGFALAGWSAPGAAFAIFTLLVLSSRAQQHHQWYLEKFDNYPKSRKILIPFVY